LLTKNINLEGLANTLTRIFTNKKVSDILSVGNKRRKVLSISHTVNEQDISFDNWTKKFNVSSIALNKNITLEKSVEIYYDSINYSYLTKRGSSFIS